MHTLNYEVTTLFICYDMLLQMLFVVFVAVILNIAGASLLTDKAGEGSNDNDDVKAHIFFIWISPIFISITLLVSRLTRMGYL